jgi:tetraacyldisaccharide 4'-kinase
MLTPLGLLYGAGTALRQLRARPYRTQARVISVGNLTAGGTGKTPIALALGHLLIGRGARVAFVTRGYGNDEAKLLERLAPTFVNPDRAAAGILADEGESDIVVLDDAHQNFALVKDLSLVVVDAEAGFGNALLIPAGPLRESVTRGLSRADAVILMGDGTPSELESFQKPMLRAHLRTTSDAFRGRPVFAFAGIGRPEKFFRTLRAIGAELRGTRSFGDHHAFTAAELDEMRKEAATLSALLVTTEKDYARLKPEQRAGIDVLPVEAVFDDPSRLDAILDRVWPDRSQARA